MRMRRNWDFDLRLQPSSSVTTTADSGDYHHRRHPREEGIPEKMGSKEEEQQQLTIFYNGRICACDVTELQARAIIMFASREMEERMKSPAARSEQPVSPSLQSQLHSPTGLSMKRSLQRFLQKRKHRAQATPYHQ